MVKKENICATCTEICEYIDEKVLPGDTIRLSLGRCYIPGKVVTNSNGMLQIEVDGDLIKGLSQIDVQELKEYLVELEHECESGICTIEAKDD